MSGDLELKIGIDHSGVNQWLSFLTDAGKLFPEFGDRLVDLVESGEELFGLDCDRPSAALTCELIIRLNPSDALLVLLAAFRARNPDFCILEHLSPPVAYADKAITSGSMQ